MPELLKMQLYQCCQEYISERRKEIGRIIAEIQEAAGNETKSSAGDKYETAREMMQQEINLNTGRLGELSRQKAALDLIDPSYISKSVIAGSLVLTSAGDYYLSISAGKLNLNGRTIIAVSSSAPLGKVLPGKRKGDRFEWNGKEVEVFDVL